MTIPTVDMRQLMNVGAHFGHAQRWWNPKMGGYIYGARDGVHIIDLDITVPLFRRALKALYECASSGGRILFVGTKRQAQDVVRETASACGQYYVNKRWLGGTLTNWPTITKSINQLVQTEEILRNPQPGMIKRELLNLERRRVKLDLALGGIREMGVVPDMLFIVDVVKEYLAVAEAKKLGIPTIAVVDTNADPDLVDFPIPGNDDALRAIRFYCSIARDTILEGAKKQMAAPAPQAEDQDGKQDAKAEGKPEAKAEDKKQEAKGEGKPEAKEAKVEAKAKAEDKPEAKAEAKAEDKPEAKAEAKSETKEAKKTEAKTDV